jgi:iron complex outermembrane receptor protein
MPRLALLLATTFLAVPAFAQQSAPATPAPPTRADDDFHGGDIIITAPFVRELDILSGTSVLSGIELVRDLRPQIGDTLARLPGVSATSFSPGASRPVLRGFPGRARARADRRHRLDRRVQHFGRPCRHHRSAHRRADRGAARAGVLLFGSQAIGGAVNVLDRRIPRRVPDEPVHLDVIATYGSADDERSIGGGVDVPLGTGGLVAHLDASYRKTNDREIGGFCFRRNCVPSSWRSRPRSWPKVMPTRPPKRSNSPNFAASSRTARPNPTRWAAASP